MPHWPSDREWSTLILCWPVETNPDCVSYDHISSTSLPKPGCWQSYCVISWARSVREMSHVIRIDFSLMNVLFIKVELTWLIDVCQHNSNGVISIWWQFLYTINRMTSEGSSVRCKLRWTVVTIMELDKILTCSSLTHWSGFLGLVQKLPKCLFSFWKLELKVLLLPVFKNAFRGFQLDACCVVVRLIYNNLQCRNAADEVVTCPVSDGFLPSR